MSENKNSDELEQSNTIALMTYDDVVIEGQKLIKNGELAVGTISKINECRNCRDKRPSIEVSVEYVKAADGQRIALHGAPLSRRSSCVDCAVELHSGMRLTANVLSNTEIRIR